MTGKDLEGYHRRSKAYKIVEESRKILHAGEFDGLVIASQYQPESILEKLLPFIRGSRPVVVYHTAKEALLETSTWMRKSSELLAPQLTESWLRKSQVLPGRTHPEMSTWGGGGCLLTATKIIDFPVQAAMTKRERLAMEKKNAEAKKLKREREELVNSSNNASREGSAAPVVVASSSTIVVETTSTDSSTGETTTTTTTATTIQEEDSKEPSSKRTKLE